MKNLFLCVSFIATLTVHAQKYRTETSAENGYAYTTVTNDPLKARIYTLSNGLKVYMSIYKNAPRIQTYIAVKAGSKNDPVSVTGLAHYLEHMVFKGTSNIGTYNWENEKLQLAKIEDLYEKYRLIKDTLTRRKIYRQIDSISGLSAKYAIANEYDKMLTSIGAQGTNAYTWVEQTVYVNDIPSNEIERWAKIEAERFSELTPRLFHTELEAVYEEKNRGLDNDMSKVIEETFAALFPHHQYGSQTTIGTVEHLKNPSIKEIKKYFYANYVPNNIAICLSGDFDPAQTIKIIDKYWGKMKSKPVPPFTSYQEAPITKPVEKTVSGPSPEAIVLCYRFPGASSNDAMIMEMFSRVLSNGQAGLMDLNLVQKQKVLNVSAQPYRMKDYSINIIFANPREGQSLKEVKTLVLAQIDSIKQGKFDEQLLKAIINNEKIGLMKQLENNGSRADYFVDAFIKDLKWEDYVAQLDLMANLTKKDIVEFANKYYGDNYVVVNKIVGKDTAIQKVIKPQITPVSVNREKQSNFYQGVMKENPAKIAPVFIDYNIDLNRFALRNKAEVLYKQNIENGLFELAYVFDFGNEHNPKIGLALSYLNYLGTDKLTAEQIKTEFYKLGCSYTIGVEGEKMQISLSGLDENLEPALKLLESLLSSPQPDPKALNDMVQGILKQRTDAKLDKVTILRVAMVSYAKYGTISPFTNIIQAEELKKITPEELVNIIKGITAYDHRIYYYGPAKSENIKTKLEQYHKTPDMLNPIPAKKQFKELDFIQNEVFWVNYDMVQAELLFLSKSVKYDKALVPMAVLYNEYFGGGMGSIVFQEIRESKALAYAALSRYSIARNKDLSNFDISYIGTQADKLPEAAKALKYLLDSIPQSDVLFNTARESILNNIRTERITKTGIFVDYENARKFGLDYDIRKDVFQMVQNKKYQDVATFHNKYVKGQNAKILVIGSKDKLDFKTLEKYGKLKELSLSEIFGY